METVEPEKPTLLVVEDDLETQIFMNMLLGGRYEVVTAATGEETRRRLAERGGEIALILMDLSLKGAVDGLELTRELRASERWGRIPIVAVTAHALPSDRRRALEAGCAAYFAKPFEPRELVAAITKLIAS
jgi:CheY-like chemotaxis protein